MKVNAVHMWSLICAAVLMTPVLAQPTKEGDFDHPLLTFVPKAQHLPWPLVDLGDGRWMSFKDGGAIVSTDRGRTWSAPTPMYEGDGPGRPKGISQAVCAPGGAIVAVYVDIENRKWLWGTSPTSVEDSRLDVWTIRSLDGGQTWQDRQRIYKGWCGAILDIIVTSDGGIVVPVQEAIPNPGRHGQAIYVSQDDGTTWTRSNLIDLGGSGDHDGVYEATLVELAEGRLWMLARTPWDRLWEAFSYDKGLTWPLVSPSLIDASSSPGYLHRLANGKLVLVWNRLYPEGEDSFARNTLGSHYPTSSHRGELSIAFSDDEGASWSQPIVIIRRPGRRVAYPNLIELGPGQLQLFVSGSQYSFSADALYDTLADEQKHSYANRKQFAR